MRTLFVLLGLLPATAHATELEQIGRGPGIDSMWAQVRQLFPHTNLGGQGIFHVTTVLISYVLLLIGSAAAAVIIYAGIQMVIANGDEGKVTEARKIALYAIMGVVLAMIGEAIVLYVRAFVFTAAGG